MSTIYLFRALRRARRAAAAAEIAIGAPNVAAATAENLWSPPA